MHNTLRRQLRRYLGDQADLNARYEELVSAISETYSHFDEDRHLLERSLEISSRELSERIDDANRQKEEALELLNELNESKKQLEEKEKNLQSAKDSLEMEAENAKKFQEAVHISKDGIIITDANQKIIYINPAWEKITGFGWSDAIGTTPRILKTTKTPEEEQLKLRAAIKNGTYFYSDEFINQRKDGTEYYAELSLYPIKRGDGSVQFLVGVHKDITDRKKGELAKNEFLTLAAHQLRTPLTSVRWILDLFRNGEVGDFTEKQQAMLLDAWKCSNEMSDTIGTMLMVSKLEAGKVHVILSKVKLADLWQEIKPEVEVLAEEKNITIHADCNCDITTETDKEIFKDILQRLVQNAIHYTSDGGEVYLSGRRINNTIEVEVRDNGCGIPKNQQDRVFTKFFRGSNVTKFNTHGNGLSLYLAKSLVPFINGDISFSSEEGNGSLFRLTIQDSAGQTTSEDRPAV